MGEHRISAADLPALGSRIREARESTGWTQQELADHLKMSCTTIVAIEKGARRLKPAELIQAASLLGRDVSDLLQQGAPAEAILSPGYIALAVEAWQQGDLSEGQLAKILRTDRLGAREIIQRLERSVADRVDAGELLDLETLSDDTDARS
jgi:transcriptional regulator with XRE-family HTH domain